LTDAPNRTGEQQRRHATLDLLPPMLDEDDPDRATITTAAVLALIFGWRFFHPYIRPALHLDDVPFEKVHVAIREQLHHLVAPPSDA
jgi:hypothetical protein